MQPRQNPIQMFATFARLTEDRFEGWVTDAKLQSSMEHHLAKTPQTSEQFWTLYWYHFWQQQSHPLGLHHLIAYLQEAGLWAAQKKQKALYNSAYSLADYFQMAMLHCDRVLHGYNPQYGSRLKDYAKVVFHSTIKNTLRQQGEVDICSDWALLRKISKKRLQKALKRQGYAPETRDRYLWAWDCYKALYADKSQGSQRLPPPSAQQWEAIATLYNQHKLTGDSTPIATAQIQTYLRQCSQAIRSYLYPHVLSLNTPLSDSESSEWIDTLKDSLNETIVESLILEEEQNTHQQQRQHINKILTDAIASLLTEDRLLLELYYRQQLNQSDIARQLNSKQYTISRRLSRLRATLLKTLVQQHSEISTESLSPERLHHISTLLEEWLERYFTQSKASEVKL